MVKVKVLLIDDHKMVRQGLSTFLQLDEEIDVVGTAADAEEGLALVEATSPDVILLDLMMPGVSGFTMLEQLHRKYPQIKVLVLTSALDRASISRAMRLGARGYLLKDIDAPELCQSIKAVSTHQTILAAQAAEVLAEQGNNTLFDSDNLTERELSVLQLLTEGLSNKEIAYRLNLREKTIKTHVSIILAKLGVQSRTQAAMQASQMGITFPNPISPTAANASH